MRSVPNVSQGWGPDGIDPKGMAAKKSLGEWKTKSTTGRLEAELPIFSVYINDITVFGSEVIPSVSTCLQAFDPWEV